MTRPPLSIAKAKPDQGLIEMLEELLEEAKSGELSGLAAITFYSNSNVGEGWCSSCGTNAFRTIGALEALKARFLAETIEF